jgi:hypothetical protein
MRSLFTCHYYSKIKEDAIYNSMFLLWLTKSVELLLITTCLHLFLPSLIVKGLSCWQGMFKADIFNGLCLLISTECFINPHIGLSILITNMLLETTTGCKVYFLITTALMRTITHQWMLLSIASMLLCTVLQISLFRVILSEKPNTLLGSLPL